MERISYIDLLAKNGIDCAHPGGLALTKQILRNETITSNMVLLDVGCGTGQTSAYIAKYYPCKVIAIDINPNMLEKARQKFVDYQLEIPLIRANAMDLPFRKDSFDIILAESVTTFTDNIRRTLQEYCRVLKPGGILLAIEGTALLPLEKTEMKDLKSILGIALLPTKNEWRQLFQEVGFNSVRVLYQQPMNWMGYFPSESAEYFQEYRKTMYRNRKKFGFGIYRCTV